jgi:thiol-disulfide isomerase/thioredoxin
MAHRTSTNGNASVKATIIASALAVLTLAAGAARGETVAGRWDATADVSGASIPFELQIDGAGHAVRGHFFNGERPTTPSTEGAFENGRLHLVFPSYAAVLDATVTDGKLEGTYTAGVRVTPIHAVKAHAAVRAAGPSPRIAGEWIIPVHSPKGETAWRLIVHQKGPAVEATILRIDGDTGTLSGRFDRGVLQLSHFAGERPVLLRVAPRPDGSLGLVLTDQSGRKELSALTADRAHAAGANPSDPMNFTTVNDKAAPFAFNFPDLAGKSVSNADPRFRHKVVVIDVMGSWCPNCHDEAPYLQTLYAKHRHEGLEIVALDFEQPDQLAKPDRLRAFIQRYGLTYTVLLAGQIKEAPAKLPQTVNLNAWPSTFFIGRDGRVKAVHVGFTSPGSGQRDIETKAAFEHEVNTLLASR